VRLLTSRPISPAIPLLWVLPLALYLLTFIIVFSYESRGVLATITVAFVFMTLIYVFWMIAGYFGWQWYSSLVTSFYFAVPCFLLMIVFSLVYSRLVHDPRLMQTILTMLLLSVLALGLAYGVGNHFFATEKDENARWVIYAVGFVLAAVPLKILPVRDPALIHRVMIMIMPLLVLLLIFMILSDLRPAILGNIGIHLATLFVVSMVCHGELARDRPAPSHLTEYFLWMSFGGVVGGLFNGLFAPIAFKAIIEYQLVMMVACLLLPPLGLVKDSLWARRADIGLAAVFLGVGIFLLIMCQLSGSARHDALDDRALAVDGDRPGPGTCIGRPRRLQGLGITPRRGRRTGAGPLARPSPRRRPAAGAHGPRRRSLLWTAGQRSRRPAGRLCSDGEHGHRSVAATSSPSGCRRCCATPSSNVRLRFGLGVGAILLTAACCIVIDDSPLHQDRSFFGVLRVENGLARLWEIRTSSGRSVFTTEPNTRDSLLYDGGTIIGYWRYDTHRLTHGTTLHGKQLLDSDVPELRDLPISYYHRTGPIGHVLRNYNPDPNRPMAVIGLGTGSMACYGLKGQTLDFFDIDPVVVGITFDTDEYFTFIEDAEDRGGQRQPGARRCPPHLHPRQRSAAVEAAAQSQGRAYRGTDISRAANAKRQVRPDHRRCLQLRRHPRPPHHP